MPIYEFYCPTCKHRWDVLTFKAEPPKRERPCPQCNDWAVRILSRVVVRSGEMKKVGYQHLYDDTVSALGIEDIAVPKSKGDDADWEAPYDPSWEDDE